MSGFVLDVSEADFEREVLERSDSVPVVVDFWAPWCGPCRVLGPMLERLAEEHAGAFVVARVDVDVATEIARAFRVQSIPALKAIHRRAIVAELEGAQPEPVLRSFLQALLPSDADRLAAAGDAAAQAGDTAAARERYAAAHAADPRHPGALLGLARGAAAAGDPAAALDWLDRIGPGTPVSDEAERLAAELRTASAPARAADEAALRERLAADPADADAQLALGRLLAAAGRHEEALETLLEAVRRDPKHADQAARLAMLDLFSILGADHPLTERYRPQLARVLFR